MVMTSSSSAATQSRQTSGVRVTGLSRSYGTQRVLHDVSFEVPDGHVCVLLGSSGSGKTTMLRLIAGLDRPQSGEIAIGDKLVVGKDSFVPPERRDIGLVFQSYALWPHMTVFEQIAYPLRVRAWRRDAINKAVKEAADMVGLGAMLQRYPSQLSGGQQQRVAFARAVVFNPRLLLLDEPLSNLDAALRREMRLQLQELQKRLGVTTIYVTHDQEEAMALADTVVVMTEGRVAADASPKLIYDHPPTAFVAAFIGASNLVEGTVVSQQGQRCEVQLADGSSVGATAERNFAANDSCLLAVKPTDLQVAGNGAGAVRFDGIIRSATYLGSHVELIIDLQGREWRVPAPRWLDYTKGQRIVVTAALERVIALPTPQTTGPQTAAHE
jgi:iron(III) transport system ATP-binding protein